MLSQPEMPSFHFSTVAYSIGHSIRTVGPGAFVSRSPRWLETEIEAARPSACVSRRQAVYVSPTSAEALAYGVREYSKARQNWSLYEVEIPKSTHWAPMCLPERLRQIQQGSPHVGDIVREYWACVRAWKFMEGLADHAVVLAVLPIPPDELGLAMATSGALVAYGDDTVQAQSIWP